MSCGMLVCRVHVHRGIVFATARGLVAFDRLIPIHEHLCIHSIPWVRKALGVLLFVDDTRNRLMRLATWTPRQVIAHHIGKYSYKHQRHCDP
jgi:hypothetical protein